MEDRERVVAEQYGGLFPGYEVFYVAAIAEHARTAIAAFRRAERPATLLDPESVLDELATALTTAAVLSLWFWPAASTPLATGRGKRLRVIFGLDETSALADARLRNTFTASDAALDRFLLEDTGAGAFAPRAVTSLAPLRSHEARSAFRALDLDQSIAIFSGRSFAINKVRESVDGVAGRARTLLRTLRGR